MHPSRSESGNSPYKYRSNLKIYKVVFSSFVMVDHIEVGTSKIGGKFLNNDYPLTNGIIAGSTKQIGHKETLEPQKTFVEKKEYKGIT